MYPQSELIRLAAFKAALRRDIARRRVDCVAAAVQAGQPLVWLDRMLGLWRQFSPYVQLAAVPLGILALRRIRSGRNLLGTVLRWAPVVRGSIRGVGSLVRHRERS